MRKVLSLLLVAATVFSLSVPAFAAESQPPAEVSVAEAVGDAGIMPLLPVEYAAIGKTWVNLSGTASNLAGRDIIIRVYDFNSVLYQVDVLFRNGQGADLTMLSNVTTLGSTAVVTCPSGAYYAFLRIAPRAGWITPERAFGVYVDIQ